VTLRGVFPPIPTPFAGDAVDHRALAENIGKWMRTPLAGLVVLGSNGEAPLLEDDEADAVLATAREHIPSGRPMIAGTGRESTAATIAATRRAAGLGADFALVRTPSYFKNVMTSEAFVRHFTAVADVSPVPVLLYNVTIYTGVNLLPEAVERLAGHPNIAGMKESASDVAQVADLVARVPDGFAVLAGSATTFFAAAAAGASGGVLALAAVLPDMCVEIFELVQRHRHLDALALQRQITPLAQLLGAVHGVAGLKYALDQIGYAGGPARSPLGPIPPAAQKNIRDELAQLTRSETIGPTL
jgi:dihydrodipicolinate synthase/N-acetylneuraminate lyase